MTVRITNCGLTTVCEHCQTPIYPEDCVYMDDQDHVYCCGACSWAAQR